MESPTHANEDPRADHQQRRQQNEEDSPTQLQPDTGQQQRPDDEGMTLQARSAGLSDQNRLPFPPGPPSIPSQVGSSENAPSSRPSTDTIHPSSFNTSQERVLHHHRRRYRRRSRRSAPEIVVFEDATATPGTTISGWYASYRYLVYKLFALT